MSALMERSSPYHSESSNSHDSQILYEQKGKKNRHLRVGIVREDDLVCLDVRKQSSGLHILFVQIAFDESQTPYLTG